MRGQTARTPEKVAEAQRMRAEGARYKDIAARFGIGTQTAYTWVNDPDGTILRDRRRKYDLECSVCGGRVDGRSPGKMKYPDEPVCIRCAGEHYATWTCDAIVCAIQEWADEHGGIPPSASDWHRARARDDSRVTSVNNVQKRFGSWNAAIRAAGFQPHAGGPIGGFTPLTREQREACAQRYAAGESSVSIAADLGCAPRIVIEWARKAGVPIRPGIARKAAA